MPSPLAKGALLARTLVHLHPAQIAMRPIQMARARLLARSHALSSFVAGDAPATLGPPLLALSGDLSADLPGIAIELERAKRALAGTQVLVGLDVPVNPPHSPFDGPLPKLVHYQQGYLGIVRSLAIAARTEGFPERDRAATLAVAHARELLERCPPGKGLVWDAYPVAIRLLNLVQARELLRPVVTGADRQFLDDALLRAIGQHARWLAVNVELHLLGNHLFSEGAAMFIAGCAIQSSGSMAWRAIGRTIIVRSIALDVLADGGHAERSPMYAAIYLDQLEFVIAAARALGVDAPAGAIPAAESMARFLLDTAHPDGEIALIGDSAIDEGPSPADVAGPLGLRPESLRSQLFGSIKSATSAPRRTSFPETGLTVIDTPDDFLILDHGPLGSSDQPGHAHADALSFELSHHGHRFISDAGAGHYANDDRRAYFRGPLGHNSISVNGRGSDEVWASWRAARRARLEKSQHTELDGVHVIRGAVRSAFGWKQERVLILAPGQALCVVDRVTDAPADARVASHLRFAPGVVVFKGAEDARIVADDQYRFVPLIGGEFSLFEGEADPFRGWTANRMGEFMPSPEIELEAAASPHFHAAAWAVLFDATVSLSRHPNGLRLQLKDNELAVDVDANGIRWELKRGP